MVPRPRFPNGTTEHDLAIDPVTGTLLASESASGQFSFAGLDGLGNVASQSGQGVTAGQYQYDPATGQLEQIDTTQTGSLSGSSDATTYYYDADGNLTKIGYADGSSDNYAYDAATLIGITKPGGVNISENFNGQGQNTGYSATGQD